jgi:hypothetical protein
MNGFGKSTRSRSLEAGGEPRFYNSLFMAMTTCSYNLISGKEGVIEGLPLSPFLRKGRLSCS